MKKKAPVGLLAIFGWPLSHTLSPRFQNAGLKALGLDIRYLPYPCTAAQFAPLLRRLMAEPLFLGGNVTNPHKIAASRLVDRLTPEARAVGAVNTLYRSGRLWVGHNTDAGGFRRSLGRLSLKGAKAAVLGAGGAARAVVHALLRAGASKVLVACRRPEQGRELRRRFGARVERRGIEAADLAALASECRFLVNTVPGPGFARLAGASLPRDRAALKAVAEISYVPLDTPLLKAARKRGLRAIGGLGMLLEQGILAFERFTGRKAPRKAMEKALYH